MKLLLKQEGLTNKWGGGCGGYNSPEKHLDAVRSNMRESEQLSFEPRDTWAGFQ